MRIPRFISMNCDRRLVVAAITALAFGIGAGVGVTWFILGRASAPEAERLALLLHYSAVSNRAEYWSSSRRQIEFEGETFARLSEAIGALKSDPSAPGEPSGNGLFLRLLMPDGWWIAMKMTGKVPRTYYWMGLKLRSPQLDVLLPSDDPASP